MLTQPVASWAVERAVITDFNYKLAAHISSFRANHFWVSLTKQISIGLLMKLLYGQVET